ncbi:hypothetical protein QBC34DRAFT_72073 [Podospora aff. communis PSN243]|uniref:Uncharacterized protein n=1 Tax=Podospora aff. communis PSN243 TaxID=3040156 RepID=A0AAV9H5T7_9PEZI|nr:hypothetical protein QBC34DRAFT_72073 [Podospora aff. communis PSN243]
MSPSYYFRTSLGRSISTTHGSLRFSIQLQTLDGSVDEQRAFADPHRVRVSFVVARRQQRSALWRPRSPLCRLGGVPFRMPETGKPVSILGDLTLPMAIKRDGCSPVVFPHAIALAPQASWMYQAVHPRPGFCYCFENSGISAGLRLFFCISIQDSPRRTMSNDHIDLVSDSVFVPLLRDELKAAPGARLCAGPSIYLQPGPRAGVVDLFVGKSHSVGHRWLT